MKPLLPLLVCLIFGVSVAYSQQTKIADNFTLTGHITGRQTDEIWFKYPGIDGKIIQQKVTVKDNSFIITGYIGSPVNAEFSIQYDPKAQYIKNYFGPLFISPVAMMVSLAANDVSSARVSGSAMQDDWDNNEQQKQQLHNAKDAINKEMWKLSSAGNTPENHKMHELLVHKAEQYDEQLKQADGKFIATHPNSYLSAYLTQYYLAAEKLTLSQSRDFYKTFSPAVKRSVAGVMLQKQLTN